jgi:deazaflavin-dependent oxidoreductase (nitroreductase family)
MRDSKIVHHLLPLCLLTSSSLEPLYSFGTAENIGGSLLLDAWSQQATATHNGDCDKKRKENTMENSGLNDWNRQIIEEFRTNGGKVGGSFEGNTLLLLTTTGAKSGQPRIRALTYLADGERLFVFAAKGGAPTAPDWYHNLIAHPSVTVEVGTERFEATAAVLEGEERDQIYAKEVQRHPGAAEYEKKAARKIPVVELIRHNSSR